MQCRVFTKKEGVLGALGHDLEFHVDRGSLDVAPDRSSVRGRFELDSMRVVNAPPADARKIEDTTRREVLKVKKFPQAEFVSSRVEREGDDYVVHGTLSLHGVSRPLTARARLDNGRWVARVELHQPDFGIVPYTAMFGAMRVAANVSVEVSIEN